MTADLESDGSPDAYDLAGIATELMLAYRKRQNQKITGGDGTGARNSGTYRITKLNLRQAQTDDTVSWLLHTRTHFGEISIAEDDVALRASLIKLGGEILAWVGDIDRRS
jgi:hypothetical protein